MRPLSAEKLLFIWEQGQRQTLAQRALLLLTGIYPDTPVETLALLTIGQRDRHLLALREQLFGFQIDGTVICPACAEKLELTFATADIHTPELPQSSDPFTLEVDGYCLQFRLPNSLDLLSLPINGTANHLIQRCLLTVTHNGESELADTLPIHIVETVIAFMEETDPQGDVKLALICPACQREWLAIFDIVSFLWAEITSWTFRVLQEVHLLASAYGWCEADILGMTAWRRHFYLEKTAKQNG